MDQPENNQPGIDQSPAFSGRRIEIRVQGHLSEVWEDWFEGLAIERLDNGEMVLSGSIPNQAALMAILNKIHRLNLTLLCVQEMRGSI